MSGRHSTMDSPEPLRRVIAPMIIMHKTTPQQVKSQYAILAACLLSWAALFSSLSKMLFCFEVFI